MGKLAMWGAVAGGAKGYQTELENREKREAADIDEQRQVRLEKMRQTHAEKMAGRREEHEKGLQETRGTQAIEQIGATGENQIAVVDATMEGRGELQDDQQEWKTLENKLDRESRELIAAAATSAEAARASKRFEAKILTVGEANEYGMMIETDTPAIYDNQAGKWFLQKGDRLTYPGDEPPKGRAPASAVNKLYKNPERAEIFYKEYSYLPSGYLTAMYQAGQAATK